MLKFSKDTQMTKIALIIDKSQSYLDFQKIETLKTWDLIIDEAMNVSNFSMVGESSLFGNPPPAVMHINDLSQLKSLLAILEAFDQEQLKQKVQHGFIMTTTVSRVSTKKLEALVTKLGGTIVLSKESSKDKTNVVTKMLAGTKIPRSVKDFITEYAGDDYESVISIVKSISTLPPASQQKLTIEAIYIRMPQSEGSVAPWEIEKPLMAGNTDETIRMYRRITQHTSYMVILSILKNKLHLAYKVGAYTHFEQTKDLAKLSKGLNVPNTYPLRLASQMASKQGVETITKIFNMILETERKVKGGSSSDSNVEMEMMLVAISNNVR